jgi:peptide subunit release factor 1 (eRF1)
MVASPDLPKQLSRLTRIRPGEHRVVSLYLKIEPRDRAGGKYLIKVKNRIKRALQGLPALGLPRDSREAVARDLHRIQDFLQSPARLPSTQGLAIFACEPLKLFETIPLPRVHRSRLGVDRSPQVREIVSTEDEFGRVLTTVLDRTAARFFEVTAFEAREVADLRGDATRGGKFHGSRRDAPGRGEAEHHNRIRAERQRHLEAVAHRLFELDRAKPVHGIVLAGPGPEAGALTPFLHEYLSQRLMGTTRLNPKHMTAPEVHTATLVVREEYERASERSLVHRLQEGQGRGWAVNGIADTLQALSRGQVRTLVVDADAGGPGYRCADSGRLALESDVCHGEGEPVPVLDIADEAIEEALRQRVDVEVVYDPEARAAVRGLASLLRFR